MTTTASGQPVRQLWWGTGDPLVVRALADLEKRLDALHEQVSGQELPLVVSLKLGDTPTDGVFWPPTLTLVLGREWSSLTYDNSALPEVNYISIGDSTVANVDPDDDFPCSWGDDFAYPRAENLIPVEYAREAVRQFWPAGDRPDICGWA